MIGLMPLADAAWWNATAPYRAPWSVRARLSKPFAEASSTRSTIRPSPSSRLNSEWVWRWTKSFDARVTEANGSRAPRGSSVDSDRGEVHGQQDPVLRKLTDSDHRPGRPVIAHLLDVGGVHRLEIAHPCQEDVDVDDVRQVRSDRFQHDGEAVEDLPGLRLNL